MMKGYITTLILVWLAAVTATAAIGEITSFVKDSRKHREDQRSIGNGIPLRIMVLGASICRGEKSTDTVGFRRPLRKTLVSLGNQVNMVGAVQLGNMTDNEVEARSGNRVDQVTYWASLSVPKDKPNLCIINVGTNDCLQDWDTPNFGQRYYDFIHKLIAWSPKTTILMSTLLTNTVQGKEPCILNLNTQIRSLTDQLKKEGLPVVLVEMHYQFVPNGDTLPRPRPSDITPDGSHPFDTGYKMMADIFMQGIHAIDKQNLLQKAVYVKGIPSDGNVRRDVEGRDG